jgi:hypothetical protein
MRILEGIRWRGEAARYGFTCLGGLICGVAINAFYVPHFLLSGGIAGIAMILHYLSSWPIGLMIAVFNVPLYYAAYRFMDRAYFLCALFGLVVFTAAIDATSFLTTRPVVDDTMLAAIFGGLVSGVGSGIVFRVNGSLGGSVYHRGACEEVFRFQRRPRDAGHQRRADDGGGVPVRLQAGDVHAGGDVCERDDGR